MADDLLGGIFGPQNDPLHDIFGGTAPDADFTTDPLKKKRGPLVDAVSGGPEKEEAPDLLATALSGPAPNSAAIRHQQNMAAQADAAEKAKVDAAKTEDASQLDGFSDAFKSVGRTAQGFVHGWESTLAAMRGNRADFQIATTGPTKELLDASADAKKDSDFAAQSAPDGTASYIGQTLAALPASMFSSGKQAVKGGAAGVVIGAAGGSAGGPVGAIGGAVTGGGIGLAAGFISDSYVTNTGQIVGDLRDAGLDDDNAKAWGYLGGSVMAALDLVGIGFAAKPFVKAAERKAVTSLVADELKRQLGASPVKDALKDYFIAAGGETAAETAQQIVQDVTTDLAKQGSGNDYKTIFNDPKRRQQVVQNAVQTAVATFSGMALMGVPGAVVTGVRVRGERNAAGDALFGQPQPFQQEMARGAPLVTPEDQASPLPTDLIRQGKGAISLDLENPGRSTLPEGGTVEEAVTNALGPAPEPVPEETLKYVNSNPVHQATPDMMDRRVADLTRSLVHRGVSPDIADGVAAGMIAEAGGDHTALNKDSGAYGLGQWLGSRKQELFKRYGPNPTRDEQLDFLVWELNGGDAGGKAVLSSRNSAEALDNYVRKFMRPAAGAETTGDLQRGTAALGGGLGFQGTGDTADETGRSGVEDIAFTHQEMPEQAASSSQEQQPSDFTNFEAALGTLGVPRAEMPQIESAHHGAFVNFAVARGVQQQEETVDPKSLKPTQAEYSPAKVEKAIDLLDTGNRAILVSSDNHILDGTHQWVAHLRDNRPVRIIRLDAPIADLVQLAHEFPSSTVSTESSTRNESNVTQPESERTYPTAPRDEWHGEADYEQRGGKIVEMSPDEYLSKVRPLQVDETSRENIDDLKRHIEEGRSLDPLLIRANGKEDGRHRAHAAKELGIQKVPVIVFGEQANTKESGQIGELAGLPQKAFEAHDHVPALKQLVKGTSISLGNLKAIGDKLGITPEQAHQALGALASQPNSGIFQTKGRPAKGKKPAIPPRFQRIAVRTTPLHLLEFVRAQGGVQSGAHDLRNVGAIARHPGVINNKSGLTLDELGLRLKEAGYVNERPTEAETIDLLDRGSRKRLYAHEDAATAQELQAQHANQDFEENHRFELKALAEHHDLNLTKDEEDAALDHVARGESHEYALEAVIREAAARALDQDTERTGDEFYREVANSLYQGEQAEQRGEGPEAVQPEGQAEPAGEAGQGPDREQPRQAGEPAKVSTAPEHATVGVDDRELHEIVNDYESLRASQGEGDEQVTHIFDPPAKGEVVRLNERTRVYNKEHGWMSPAEARAKIREWEEHAVQQGKDFLAGKNRNGDKIVLSFFDLSGEWSLPWDQAGYQVWRFDIQNDPEDAPAEEKMGDVNNFSADFFGDWFGDFEGLDVHAILAANPCTDFASSGARHFAAKDKDGRTVASVRLVQQTLAAIEYFKPAVWALENPVGRIEKLGGLPPWRLSFDPNDVGETYTKKTLIWGRFNAGLPIAPVEPVEGSKMHKQYGGKSLATKNARSVTPEGFAYAFFMANNAIDHPAMTIANKYDRLDRGLIEQATKAGITEQQIDEAVQDHYYQDLDDEAANAAIRELIGEAKPQAQEEAKPEDVLGPRATDTRDHLQRKADEGLKAKAEQKPVGSDGGLFDTQDTTGDLFAGGATKTVTPPSDPVAKAKATLQSALDELNGAQESPAIPEAKPEPTPEERGMKPLFDSEEPTKQVGFFNEQTGKTELTDVGEKIGGARKDMFAERGLQVSDLENMSRGEAHQLTTKENVWPKPDYAKMAEEGADPAALAGAKLLRDSLAARPKVDSDEGRADYIEAMRAAREILAEVKTADDLKGVQSRLYERLGLPQNSGYGYYAANNTEEAKLARRRLFSMFKGNTARFSVDYKMRKKIEQMVAQGWPSSAIEGWTRRFDVRLGRGKDGEKWFVTNKQRRIVADGLDSKEEAEAKAKELYEGLTKNPDGTKKAPTRPHLDRLERTGKDIRGGRDVRPEDFLTDFGFRGVEFGNWVANDERQKATNLAYEGLHDLADTLGFPPETLSLGGQLGLAFGARGSGSAAAHYEPGKLVINLTKLKGAGTLAHEWGHALDHYFGSLDSELGTRGAPTYASGGRSPYSFKALGKLRPELAQAFDGVMDALFSREKERAEIIRDAELKIEQLKAGIARQQERLAAAPKGNHPSNRKFIKESKEWIAYQERRLKAFGDRIAEARDEAKPLTPQKVESSYYQNAQLLSGQSGKQGYWARPTELFARAFEAYAFDKIKERGNLSQYLVQGVEENRFPAELYGGNPYPAGKERQKINAAFNKLFETVETRAIPAPREGGPTQALGQAGDVTAAPFYSALERGIAQATTKRAPAQQWLATLSRTPGVKKEELEWSGVEDWLKMQEGAVDREALLGVVRGKGIKVDEVVLGNPNERVWWIGGRRFSSLEAARAYAEEHPTGEYLEDQPANRPQYSNWSSDPSNDTYRELLITLPLGEGGNPYRAPSTHWDTEAVVAHARFMDKTDAEGKRVLFVEEVQSDWHQKGRDQGYAAVPSDEERSAAIAALRKAGEDRIAALVTAEETANGLDLMPDTLPYGVKYAELDTRNKFAALQSILSKTLAEKPDLHEKVRARIRTDLDALLAAELRFHEANTQESAYRTGIPDAPFKSTWPALVMKRLIRWATDNGYDKVAWTTGEEQAARYNLSRATGPISVHKTNEAGTYYVGMDARAKAHLADNGLGTRLDVNGVDLSEDQGMTMTADQLKEAFGADVAKRLVEGVEAIDIEAESQKHRENIRARNAAADALLNYRSKLREEAYAALKAQGVRDDVAREEAQLLRDQVKATGRDYATEQAKIEQMQDKLNKLTRAATESRRYGWFKLDGEGLNVGGGGMKAFYDRNLVNITNDILKKYGTKVAPVGLPPPESRITTAVRDHPDVREARGQALLVQDRLNNRLVELGGEAAPRGVGRDDAYAQRLEREYQAARDHALEVERQVREQVQKGEPHAGFELNDKLKEAAASGLPLFKRGVQRLNLTAEQVSQLQTELQAQLDKMIPGNRIRLAANTSEALPLGKESFMGQYWNRVIGIALDRADKPFVTLAHETWHAVGPEGIGLLTKTEYNVVNDRGWADPGIRAHVLEHYPGESLALQKEEAGAFWIQTSYELRNHAPTLQRIIYRIDRFFGAVKQAVMKVFGKGGMTARDVADKLFSGEIGQRPEGFGDTVRGRPVRVTFGRKVFTSGEAAPQGQAGYHGTAHDFDEFSTQHIGTGEGAQVYGWGLYFASKKSVAEFYKEALSKRTGFWGVKGYLHQPSRNDAFLTVRAAVIGKVPDSVAPSFISKVTNEILDGVEARDDLEHFRRFVETSDWDQADKAVYRAAIDAVKSENVTFDRKQGRLYEVDLPDEHEYLDWDKPLTEQPEQVKQALQNLGFDTEEDTREATYEIKRDTVTQDNLTRGGNMAVVLHYPDGRTEIVRRYEPFNGGKDFHVYSGRGGFSGYRGSVSARIIEQDMQETGERMAAQATKEIRAEPMTGEQAYKVLTNRQRNQFMNERTRIIAQHGYDAGRRFEQGFRPDKAASEALLSEGVPGLRYLDGNSRNAGDGTHNYVVFDDSRVAVRAKYQKGNPVTINSSHPERLFGPVRAILDAFRSGTSERMGKALDNFREVTQDRMLPVLRTQASVERMLGRKLDDAENPYLAEELFHGRTGARLDALAHGHVEPLFEAMKQAKVTPDELETFLYARHAPERNKRIAEINPAFQKGTGSGMTDADAQAIMDAVDASGNRGLFDSLAGKVDAMLREALDIRVESGLLSKDEADVWRKTYQNYVPLRGLAGDEELEGQVARINRQSGMSVKGKESRRAFGRKSEARDILAYSILQAEEAVVRAEQNEVAKALGELAKAAPDETFWKVDKVRRVPVFNKSTGQVSYRSESRIAAEDAPFTVSYKVDGTEHRVTFNRNDDSAVRTAAAMRNLNIQQYKFIVATAGAINRFYSKINTSWSPEFVISNAFRDLQTAGINLAGVGVKGLEHRVLLDYPAALKAATKGAFGKEGGKWGEWYHEFRMEGGQTAFNDTRNIADLRKQVAAAAKVHGRLAPRQLLRTVFRTIDHVNDGVENALRLATYKNARELGLSKKQAASLAKNVTVNFNRKGSAGPVINALYLFYNASAQGSVRILQAMKSRKVQAMLVGAVGLGFYLQLLNSMGGDTDDDGEKFYDKIPEFDKQRNLIVMLDGGKYIKIPMPWGYNVFPNFGRMLARMWQGERPMRALGDWATGALDAFNPIGGAQSILDVISPTITDPIVDLVRNRDYAGRPIMPDPKDPGSQVPNSQRYWNSVPPYWKAVTDWLNTNTGGDNVRPGAIDVSPEVLDFLQQTVLGSAGNFVRNAMSLTSKALSDDPTSVIDSNEIPFSRRVLGNKPAWYDRSAFYARLAQVEQDVTYGKTYIKQGNREGLQKLFKDERDVVSMAKAAKEARKEMRATRKVEGQLSNAVARGEVSNAQAKEVKAKLADRETQIINAFNSIYLQTVEKPIRP